MRLRWEFLAFSLALVGLWQGLASLQVLDPLFFPAPAAILTHGWALVLSGVLPEAIAQTLTRTFVGFGAGALVGLAAGLLMGRFARICRALEPFWAALYTTPKMALLPLAVIVFGLGESSRLVLVALASAVVVQIQTLDGFRSLNPRYLELASNYGADWKMRLRRIYLPAVASQLFTGLRLGLGRALMVTIAVEVLTSPDGLGGQVWSAAQTFRSEEAYATVFVVAALGASLQGSLHWLERRAVRWKPA